MKIRSAEASDYEAIASIRDKLVLDVSRLDEPGYAAAVEQNGFLMPVEISQTGFTERASDYIIGEARGEVVGFLRLDDEQEMDPDEVPLWVDPAMDEVYWEMPHANIGKIAVLPGVRKRGVAAAMLSEAEYRAKERGAGYLFAFIVTCHPPTNHPSIRFHTKHGFQRIAPLEAQVAYGISDYVATMYGKKMS